MEKYGFVYIWYDRKHKRFYIGCRWGDEKDGYICSSRWMNASYKRRPQDFKRRILKRIYTTRKDLLEEEYYWLQQIKPEELRVRYYNLQNKKFNHWTALEEQEQIKQKISKSLTSKDKETKSVIAQKISETKTGVSVHSDEYKERRRQMALGNPGGFGGTPGMQGRKHSEETKAKMKKAALGRKQTKESIEKMKATKAANPQKHSKETRRKIAIGMSKVRQERKNNWYLKGK